MNKRRLLPDLLPQITLNTQTRKSYKCLAFSKPLSLVIDCHNSLGSDSTLWAMACSVSPSSLFFSLRRRHNIVFLSYCTDMVFFCLDKIMLSVSQSPTRLFSLISAGRR